VPNLIELQLNSYKWFLEEGLPELFRTFSPIWDFTQTNYIELVSFTLGEPKYSLQDCRDRDLTYETPIKAIVRFGGRDREVIESEVYLGDLPLMTDKGTFIINGRERVIVSQLSRSPGLYFEEGVDTSMQVVVSARVIPNEGPWLEMESDANMVVRTQISQTKKLPLTQLMKALSAFEKGRARVHLPLVRAIHRKLAEPIADAETGEVLVEAGTLITQSVVDQIPEELRPKKVYVDTPLASNEEILFTFGKNVVLEKPTADDLVGKRLLADLFDAEHKLVARRLDRLERETAKKIESLELESLEVLDVLSLVEATLDQDPTSNWREAILDIYKRLRPGESANEEAARQLIFGLFFDVKRYDLGRVGRRFLNNRLGIDIPLDVRNLTAEDLADMMFAMEPYLRREAERDDIDDLKNKRVRSVGELLQQQLRLGFVRMEKVARERMTSTDQENLLPGIILSVKPVSASIKSFFSSNQLSTFMDQTNPLSELTNKRRLSSLGPGGLQRTSAKLEVRDVHRSHYGRICPIETPEGPNIGLISQLTTHARVDEFGFIMTPYRKVNNGRVEDDIIYMTAQEETGLLVAPADITTDEGGMIVTDRLQVRCAGGDLAGASYPVVARSAVDYMDVSPVQIVSVATALIPFLENDDANRALMGANMQRQAVPLLRSERPFVGTGYERTAAVDSGAAVIAFRPGTVELVTSLVIKVKADEDGELDTYNLMHMVQSNKSTCFTHRPVVEHGQRVLKGDALADGACCDEGNLALGKNVLVAFMPWGGYNYEDAILISERVVKDDVYTSIHIERHETEAVDTKLGPEEITRDIPNVGEEALKDLDEMGIIRIGAEVRPEDILVGKVAPKGQVEMTAEERLIIAIFGKKAEETRDVSLRLPHGEKGTVVDVKVFSRYKYLSPSINYIYKESKKRERLVCDRTDEPLIQIPGDELPAGTNMTVQVYTAQKRKLMVGDKMAGRHGNKGVISKILPVEDMPFLADGTPVDIVLNPLGVPSRMNIGQILETHLGYAGKKLNVRYHCPAFEGATEHEVLGEMDRMAEAMRRQVLGAYVNSELDLNVSFQKDDLVETMFTKIDNRLRELDEDHLNRITEIVSVEPTRETQELLDVDIESWMPMDLEEEMGEPYKADDSLYQAVIDHIEKNAFRRAGIDPRSCKSRVRDGLTGDELPNPITVGMIYMLKLEHLADEKIHARSIGPYSLVTQQPLGGKAQFGGQRFGEMEVWALEAYGAAYTLQELLTIKSDDVMGRVKAYESIVKGETLSEPGIPESFKILVNELRSLCLRVTVEDTHNKEIPLKDLDELASGDDMRLARSVGFFN
jgi:DNA-directed RNA polymerase subunit beta